MSDIWKPKTVVSRDEHGEAIYHKNESSDPQKHVIEATIRLPDFPPSKPCEKKPDPKWYQFTEGKKWALEVLAFCILCASGVIYYCQMEANRTQAEAAEGALKETHQEWLFNERPWVGVVTPSLSPQYSQEHIGMECTIQNSGHTPALIQAVDTIVEFADSSITNVLYTRHMAGFAIAPAGVRSLLMNEAHPITAAQFEEMQELRAECRFIVKILYKGSSGTIGYTEFGFKATGRMENMGPGTVIQSYGRDRME